MASEQNMTGYENIMDGGFQPSAGQDTIPVNCGRRGNCRGRFGSEPAVTAEDPQEVDISQREIFGPVAPPVTLGDFGEAIAFAADFEYELASSMYTRDLIVALRLYRVLRSMRRTSTEPMEGYHVGWRKRLVGGADDNPRLREFARSKSAKISATEASTEALCA